MRPVPQIIAMLRADTAVAAIVGSSIFADYPPQDHPYPLVVLTIPSGVAFGTVDNSSVRAYSSRLTVDVACDSRALTEQLMEAIEDTLDGFSSADSTHPIQGVTVNEAFTWELLTPKDGSDERAFVCSQDYLIDYKRISA